LASGVLPATLRGAFGTGTGSRERNTHGSADVEDNPRAHPPTAMYDKHRRDDCSIPEFLFSFFATGTERKTEGEFEKQKKKYAARNKLSLSMKKEDEESFGVSSLLGIGIHVWPKMD